MRMELRRLSQTGIDEFRSYLHQLRERPDLRPPVSLLLDADMSEPLDDPLIVDVPGRFETRMAFARWLYNSAQRQRVPVPRNDQGFWCWLSLALFDQVAPPNSRGQRKPGADARHIPDTRNWQRRYRHLLANPFDVYHLHRDDPTRAYVALVHPLHVPGELTEQFTSRIEIVSCPGTMTLASYLYVDPLTGKRRKGASGSSARRFGKVMNQYTRTFDLPAMDATEFARILPPEFSRFAAAAEEALTATES
jgi:hypothetical protein